MDHRPHPETEFSMSTEKQLAFEVAGGAPSQCDLIREYLTARPLEWVPLPKLYEISGALAVATRISNLNKPYKERGEAGPFQNHTDNSTTPKQSFYRYAPTSE